MADSNDDTRRKSSQGIHDPHRAVQFAVDFPFIQDVRTGNIEYGFLSMSAENREQHNKQCPELE